MNQKQRILKMLSDLYDGNPWTDLSILQVVGDLTAEQASAKPLAQMHSVWEYLNHIIFWRTRISRIMSGQEVRQEGDPMDFGEVSDASEVAWSKTMNGLAGCQKRFMEVVSEVCDGKLDYLDEGLNATNYELIHGIAQHDTYHLGQAMIVKKVVASESRFLD